MHLQYHLALELPLLHLLEHLHHRNLDEVGGGALDGRVDGVALRRLAQQSVLRVDVADIAAATQQCLYIEVFAGELQRVVQILRDFRETAVVIGDELAGVGLRNLQAVGQPEGGDAVQDAEVDRLGGAPHILGHLILRHAEDVRSHRRVDVLAALEGLYHPLVATDVRHDAQLNLRIVGGQDNVVFVGGHESLADVATPLGAHRDVLQVRVHRAETPRGGDRLRERGVDAPRLGINQLR